MKHKETGSGEWNTLIEYTFEVSRDFNREQEKQEAEKKYGRENWALIAHLCDKYPYSKRDKTPHWPEDY